jgi:hypothetical protein
VPPLAAVSEAAKARGIVWTDGLFIFACVLQEAARISTRKALAANGHFVLLKAVEKLARVAFFAAVVEPVAADFALVNGLEGQPLCRIGNLRLQRRFEFKADLHLLDL